MFAMGIALVIWTDSGTVYNHLVDVIVLVSLVAGETWARDATGPKRPDKTVTAVLLIALGWSMIFSYDQLMAKHVRGVVTPTADGLAPRWSLRPLLKYIPAGSRLLSEDPTVPVMLGRVPVVEDPFMVPRIGQRHPEYLQWLVHRVNAKVFDEVILEKRIDRAPSWWYGSLQFGPDVINAISANYRLAAQVGAYFVYLPRD